MVLSFASVSARINPSNATEEPNEIGDQTGTGSIWQFDPKGVGGPVVERY